MRFDFFEVVDLVNNLVKFAVGKGHDFPTVFIQLLQHFLYYRPDIFLPLF